MTEHSPTLASQREERLGLIQALIACGVWALFPLYWEHLDHVGALEIAVHRVVWMGAVCLIALLIRQEMAKAWAILRTPRLLLALGASAFLVSINWTVYVWAVNNGQILQASMGYYLNPLLNIVTALAFFKERLRPVQWVAIALPALGVAYAGVTEGAIPYIALLLACAFAGYGAIRKAAPVEAIPGLLIETMLIMPFALGWIAWISFQGQAHFLNGANGGWGTDALLIGGGLLTAIPLLCYAAAARRLPFSTLGMLFYIGPSGLFLLGALVYEEPVTPTRMIMFGFIWTGLALFSWERRRQARRCVETAL